MAEVTTERIVEQEQVGDQQIVRETTSNNPNAVAANQGINKMIQVVYFILGVLEVLLGLRLVLQLFGASQSSPFVDFIYSLTYPFVAPFYGVFGQTVQYGTARLELETLLAMAIYALIAWGIASLLRLGK